MAAEALHTRCLLLTRLLTAQQLEHCARKTSELRSHSRPVDSSTRIKSVPRVVRVQFTCLGEAVAAVACTITAAAVKGGSIHDSRLAASPTLAQPSSAALEFERMTAQTAAHSAARVDRAMGSSSAAAISGMAAAVAAARHEVGSSTRSPEKVATLAASTAIPAEPSAPATRFDGLSGWTLGWPDVLCRVEAEMQVASDWGAYVQSTDDALWGRSGLLQLNARSLTGHGVAQIGVALLEGQFSAPHHASTLLHAARLVAHEVSPLHPFLPPLDASQSQGQR